MAQHNPSVTPWTGNPVVTGYIVSGVVWGLIYLAKSKGQDIPTEDRTIITELLKGPVAEVVGFVSTVVIMLYTRFRAYSELSVKNLTGEERPAVPGN